MDYIRTAKAKGLNSFFVVFKHALRNSLNPVITAVSGWFASLLAGAVFVEYIFAWNGLGKEIVDALSSTSANLLLFELIRLISKEIIIEVVTKINAGRFFLN